MNLSTLELFCLVAKVGKFSIAANIMHLTKPAVSAQMNNLEKYLNVKLFERTNQGVSLTEPGKIVYKNAQKMLQLAVDLEKELDSVLGNTAQPLSIGATSTVGDFAIPCTIWNYKEKFPEVNLELKTQTMQLILEGILSGTIDLGVIEGELSHPEIAVNYIGSDHLVIVSDLTNKWANKSPITLEEFTKIPLMLPTKGSGVRKVFEDKIKELSMDLADFNIIGELSSTAALKSFVESGKGISICCNLVAQKELRRNMLTLISVEELSNLTISFYLIYHKDRTLSTHASRFIRFLCPDKPFFC